MFPQIMNNTTEDHCIAQNIDMDLEYNFTTNEARFLSLKTKHLTLQNKYKGSILWNIAYNYILKKLAKTKT